MNPTALPEPSPTLVAALDPLARTVLALADGSRTVAQIIAEVPRRVGQPVAPWQVHGALDVLRGAGLVVAGDGTPRAQSTIPTRSLGVLAAASALLALGVVPAHASEPAKDAEAETSDDATPSEPDDDGADEADRGAAGRDRATQAEKTAKIRAQQRTEASPPPASDKRLQQEKKVKKKAAERGKD